ncbi:MAG: hypothetical protein ABI794_15905, partial [Betaproteobacteria bacterium]
RGHAEALEERHFGEHHRQVGVEAGHGGTPVNQGEAADYTKRRRALPPCEFRRLDPARFRQRWGRAPSAARPATR